MVTWSDLSYSLAPNNTDQVALGPTTGVGTRTPIAEVIHVGLVTRCPTKKSN